MKSQPSPRGVVLNDGRSINDVADSFIDPFSHTPLGYMLEECISVDSQAVLSCQGKTFDEAARVLWGLLEKRDEAEKTGDFSGFKKKEQVPPPPIDPDASLFDTADVMAVADPGSISTSLQETTGELDAVESANDIPPVDLELPKAENQ
jgi:hypothetical protein